MTDEAVKTRWKTLRATAIAAAISEEAKKVTEKRTEVSTLLVAKLGEDEALKSAFMAADTMVTLAAAVAKAFGEETDSFVKSLGW